MRERHQVTIANLIKAYELKRDVNITEAPSALKEIRTKDASGRVISTYEGHPMDWMKQFSSPPQRIVTIKTR
jgi:hypothetical protein